MSSLNVGHMKPGQSAYISTIEAETVLRQRLHALGFRKGQQIELLRRAWMSGPLHIRLGTTEVMLRRRDAGCISIDYQAA